MDVVVHANHRRQAAASEASYFFEAEGTVRNSVAVGNVQIALDLSTDLFGAQHMACGPHADLEVALSSWL